MSRRPDPSVSFGWRVGYDEPRLYTKPHEPGWYRATRLSGPSWAEAFLSPPEPTPRGVGSRAAAWLFRDGGMVLVLLGGLYALGFLGVALAGR
jgi:hypothetical protein